MKETFDMWRLMRFFRKNAGLLKLGGKKVDKDLLLELLTHTKSPRVSKVDLAGGYVQKRVFSKAKEGENPTVAIDKIYALTAEANSLVESCIQDGYLNEENGYQVYLTVQGKRFSGIEGLLKQWILDLGILWSSVITVLISALVIKAPAIWAALLSAIQYLSNRGS